MIEETPAFQTEEEKPKEGAPWGDLYPYSFSRKAATNAMGLRYGYVPAEAVIKTEGLFRYNGDFGDTIKFLWILTRPNASEVAIPKSASMEERRELMSVWTVQRAEKMPDEAYCAAQEWAQSIGIKDDKSEEFYAAYIQFLMIMKSEDKADFTVTTTSDGPQPPAEPPDPNA